MEIIAAELLGKEIERFIVKLPTTPFIIKKGETVTLPISIKPGSKTRDEVKFKLETVWGPVPDFEVILRIK